MKTPEQVAGDVYWTISDFPLDPNGDDLRELMAKAIEADRAQRLGEKMSHTFTREDAEIAWNGRHDNPWIDLDLHDDGLPEHVPSIVARLMLQPGEAREVAARLADQADLAQRDTVPVHQDWQDDAEMYRDADAVDITWRAWDASGREIGYSDAVISGSQAAAMFEAIGRTKA